MQVADQHRERLAETATMLAMHDLLIGLLRETFPEFPIISTSDRATQVRRLTEAWLPVLNGDPEGRRWSSGSTESRAVAPDRALDRSYVRMQGASHEASQADSHTIALESFVAYHASPLPSADKLVRLIVFTTIPFAVPGELLTVAEVALQSFSMSRRSPPPDESPLFPFQPVLDVQAPAPQILAAMDELADQPCLWYSNVGLITKLRHHELLPAVPLIEKCDSPRLVLRVAGQSREHTGAQPTYGQFSQLGEMLIGLFTPDRFSFTLADEQQVQAFEAEAQRQDIARHEEQVWHSRGITIACDTLARLALWGFVGR
jgi:hypothetical protein